MIEIPTGPAWLFCPADRPERFAKAAAAADVVILDLEDGVAAASRPAARSAVRAATLDPARTVIRINPVGTPDHADDVAAVRDTAFTLVMLAKAESVAQLDGLADLSVIALCETPLGVLRAPELAEQCSALMWGAEDLLAALGGTSSRDASGRYRPVAMHARSSVLLAASAAGTPVLDAVYLDIADLDGLATESADAMASGFTAKACIHPSQVAVVRDAFSPSPDEIAYAQRVLDAAADPNTHGVFSLDGRMVDEPLIRQARRLLSRAPQG